MLTYLGSSDSMEPHISRRKLHFLVVLSRMIQGVGNEPIGIPLKDAIGDGFSRGHSTSHSLPIKPQVLHDLTRARGSLPASKAQTQKYVSSSAVSFCMRLQTPARPLAFSRKPFQATLLKNDQHMWMGAKSRNRSTVQKCGCLIRFSGKSQKTMVSTMLSTWCERNSSIHGMTLAWIKMYPGILHESLGSI